VLLVRAVRASFGWRDDERRTTNGSDFDEDENIEFTIEGDVEVRAPNLVKEARFRSLRPRPRLGLHLAIEIQ